jgi:translation elongation factor EF-Ts
MAHRVSHYIHSDGTSKGKGGALLKVATQTDFAANTSEVGDFARKAAMMAYAAGARNWSDLVTAYPEMAEALASLSNDLRETVSVPEIAIVH